MRAWRRARVWRVASRACTTQGDRSCLDCGGRSTSSGVSGSGSGNVSASAFDRVRPHAALAASPLSVAVAGAAASSTSAGAAVTSTAMRGADALVYAAPVLTTRVIGRGAELKTLWQNVLSGCTVQLLVGVDGVGKSTVAAEFCERVRRCGHFSCIQWFAARHALASQLQRFAAAMRARRETRVLLVLDDVQLHPSASSYEVACLRRLLTRPHAGVFVLVTTSSPRLMARVLAADRDEATRRVAVVPLAPLPRRDARELAVTTAIMLRGEDVLARGGDVWCGRPSCQRLCHASPATSDDVVSVAAKAGGDASGVPLLVVLTSALAELTTASHTNNNNSDDNSSSDGNDTHCAREAAAALCDDDDTTSSSLVRAAVRDVVRRALAVATSPRADGAASVQSSTTMATMTWLLRCVACVNVDDVSAALLRAFVSWHTASATCVRARNGSDDRQPSPCRAHSVTITAAAAAVPSSSSSSSLTMHSATPVRAAASFADADATLRAAMAVACKLCLLRQAVGCASAPSTPTTTTTTMAATASDDDAVVYVMHSTVAAVLRETVCAHELHDVSQCLLTLWPRRWRGDGRQVALRLVWHAQALHAAYVSRCVAVSDALLQLLDRAATFLAHYEGNHLDVAAQLWHVVYEAHQSNNNNNNNDSAATTTTTTTTRSATTTTANTTATGTSSCAPTATTVRVAHELGRVLHRLGDARAAAVLRSAYTQACAVHGPCATTTLLVLGCFAVHMDATAEHIRILHDAAAILRSSGIVADARASSTTTSTTTTTAATLSSIAAVAATGTLHSEAELRMLRETYAVLLCCQQKMLVQLGMHTPPTLLRDLDDCRRLLRVSGGP